MKEFIKTQQKIAPELIKVVERRYTILRTIFYFQPIGRRTLAEKIGISERKVRNNLDFLKKQRFINSTGAGTEITEAGKNLFYQLDDYIKIIQGLDHLELKLKKKLGLREVYIVPTNSNEIEAKRELGRFTAKFLYKRIQNEDILAVTGGTTLATVAGVMFPREELTAVTVVPGRGGLGEEVEIQANTIAAKIAKKLGGKYHLLHLPDNLNEDLMNTIVKEPQIKEVLNLVKNADILIHGIGTAEVMAKRREIEPRMIEELLTKGAVGEAFGYYFNQSGEIIYSTASVGLRLEELKEIETTIAVAGGKDKAEAIIAVVSDEYQDVLITEQQTAERMLNLLGDN
jgi:central glycolytic genes regulator